MKSSVFFIICLVGLSTVSCQLNRERFARRKARQCIREQKLEFDVAVRLSKGDFSNDSKEVKCFLSCFASKMKLLTEEGEYNKEEFEKYADLIVPENVPTMQILTDCEENVVKGEDKCENAYNAYKCYWDEIKNLPEDMTKSTPFSLYRTLGFDRLNEEETDEEKTE